jgi:hypothetical protein
LVVEPLLRVGLAAEQLLVLAPVVIDIAGTPPRALAVVGRLLGLGGAVRQANGPRPAVLDTGATLALGGHALISLSDRAGVVLPSSHAANTANTLCGKRIRDDLRGCGDTTQQAASRDPPGRIRAGNGLFGAPGVVSVQPPGGCAKWLSCNHIRQNAP